MNIDGMLASVLLQSRAWGVKEGGPGKRGRRALNTGMRILFRAMEYFPWAAPVEIGNASKTHKKMFQLHA